MAGGYICKKFEWDGGRTDTHAERCAFVLKGCAQALLDTNTGWALDTAKNATLDDYTQASGDKLYESNSYVDSPCYILFFTSTSGAKMMLGYRYGYTKRDGSTYNGAFSADDSVGNWKGYGLFASIIPPGSNDSFGTTSPYRSGDATPVSFTAIMRKTTSSSYYIYNNQSFAFSNDANITFAYFIITDGVNLIVLNKSNIDTRNEPLRGGFVCGRIFSTLFNGQDDAKKAGAFYLTWCACYNSTSDGFPAYEYFINSAQYSTKYGINNDSEYFTSNYRSDNGWLMFNNYRAYQKADGTWENGAFSTNTSGEFRGETIAAASSQLSENVGTKRWVPCYMYGIATPETIAEHEIVAGGGNTLKGYIDPDLARIVNNNSRYARGTTFDNGNLIYLGGGLAVGWDPSNTVAIF